MTPEQEAILAKLRTPDAVGPPLGFKKATPAHLPQHGRWVLRRQRYDIGLYVMRIGPALFGDVRRDCDNRTVLRLICSQRIHRILELVNDFDKCVTQGLSDDLNRLASEAPHELLIRCTAHVRKLERMIMRHIPPA
jgi:hypothetical protein